MFVFQKKINFKFLLCKKSLFHFILLRCKLTLSDDIVGIRLSGAGSDMPDPERAREGVGGDHDGGRVELQAAPAAHRRGAHGQSPGESQGEDLHTQYWSRYKRANLVLERFYRISRSLS